MSRSRALSQYTMLLYDDNLEVTLALRNIYKIERYAVSNSDSTESFCVYACVCVCRRSNVHPYVSLSIIWNSPSTCMVLYASNGRRNCSVLALQSNSPFSRPSFFIALSIAREFIPPLCYKRLLWHFSSLQLSYHSFAIDSGYWTALAVFFCSKVSMRVCMCEVYVVDVFFN